MNKRNYNFFRNSVFAISGLKNIIHNETSFKIELFVICSLCGWYYYLDINGCEMILLIISSFMVLIAEAVNTSVERVVDLVTLDYDEKAKIAKDVGSAVVLLAIVQFVIVNFIMFMM